METTASKPSLWQRTTTYRFLSWQRSTIIRFFCWLFSRRVLSRLLFGLAALATLIALAYAVTNWRGKRAWERYKAQLEAQGEQLDFAAFIPPRVPDDQNFAMTPFLAPLFDFNPEPKSGIERWRDTNGYMRVNDFATPKYWPQPSHPGNWHQNKRTDLAAWCVAFERGRARRAGQKGPIDDIKAPQDQAQAAALVLAALREHDPVFEELRQASQRPHSRFNIRYDQEDPWSLLLPHLTFLRRACQMLQVRASANLMLGHSDLAFADAKLMLYLANTMEREPILISQLVRVACFQTTMQVVWEGLAQHQWSEAQLQEFQAHFLKLNFLADAGRGLRADRIWGNKWADLLRNSPHRGARLASIDDAGVLVTAVRGTTMADVLLGLVPSGWFYEEQLNYSRLMQELVLPGIAPIQKRIDPALSQQNKQRLDAEVKRSFRLMFNHRVMAAMFLPSLGNIHFRFGNAQATADQAALACALERCRLAEGRYPDQLQALVPRFLPQVPHDVINGQPFKYRRTDDGRFVLYSVGWNQTDEGGVPAFTQGKPQSPDLKQGDWVWQYPAAK